MTKAVREIKRRILKAKISFLSLCPRGMNQIQTMFKSEDGENHEVFLSTLIKGDMTEQGELLAVVYAPDMVDGEGDTASAEVIKEMAYDFGAEGKGIDIKHNEKALPTSDAFVAETFIIQKGDPRFEDTKDYDGNGVDVTGGWGVVLKIENEDLRKQYRDGSWGGISMGGLMQATTEDSDVTRVIKMLSKVLGSIIPGTHNQSKKVEKSMDAKEKKEIIESVTKAVLDTQAEVIKKAEEDKNKKAAEDTKLKLGMGFVAPVLKENPTDEDVEKHSKNLMIFELSKAVDSSDLDSIHKFNILKQQIIEGQKVDIRKQGNVPFDAFSTNQTASNEPEKGNSKDPVGDAILAQLAKEETDKKKQVA